MDPQLKARFAPLIQGTQPPTRITKLLGDASTRAYYRAHYADETTAVVMVYPEPGSADERIFLEVQHFLRGLDLPVPEVLERYPAQGLVILEDLGDELLETVVRKRDETFWAPLYREAVGLLLLMRRKTAGLASGCIAFTLAFDEEKLMQEMGFFMTHFVNGFCGSRPSPLAAATLDEFFQRICRILAAEPRILTHRDYHSRNLIVQHQRLRIIDFQDARMGPAQYDLASLLRDSYVTVPEAVVDDLLDHYLRSIKNDTDQSKERFRSIFDLMSLQRNIKALGTFGYQASVRGSTRYLSSIPRTARYVAGNIAKYADLDAYRSVVEDLIVAPALSIHAS